MVACKHTQWSTVMWKNRMTLAEGGRLSSKTSCCSVGRKKRDLIRKCQTAVAMSFLIFFLCCCFGRDGPFFLCWYNRIILRGKHKILFDLCIFCFFFTCLCGGSYAQTMRVMTWFSGRELSDTAECRFVRSWKLCVRFLWKGGKKNISKGVFQRESQASLLTTQKMRLISAGPSFPHTLSVWWGSNARWPWSTRKKGDAIVNFFFIASNIFRKALQKMGSFELTRKQLAHTTLENNLGREMKGRVLKGLTLSKKKESLCVTHDDGCWLSSIDMK